MHHIDNGVFVSKIFVVFQGEEIDLQNLSGPCYWGPSQTLIRWEVELGQQVKTGQVICVTKDGNAHKSVVDGMLVYKGYSENDTISDGPIFLIKHKNLC